MGGWSMRSMNIVNIIQTIVGLNMEIFVKRVGRNSLLVYALRISPALQDFNGCLVGEYIRYANWN
jgi:uncharacterized membrane protein